MIRTVLLVAGIPLLLPFPAPTQKTLLVPGQYATIQAAIDAASSQDSVLVAPGRYLENINFKGKRIRVVSREGPEATVIDGDRKDSVVTFVSEETPDTLLSGFTLTRGEADYGGAVFCAGDARPTIAGNIITRNRARNQGGGLYVTRSAPLVQANDIHHNQSPWGGGIAVHGPPVLPMPVFDGNRIHMNRADQGGGIYCDNATLANNIIFKNRARAGAGLACRGKNDVTGNTIVFNTAHQHGGGIAYSGSPGDLTRLTNTILWGNAAQENVQLSKSEQKDLTVSHCLVQHGLSWGKDIVDVDPLFTDPDADDYHLRADSPAIDRGSDQAPSLPATDLDGDPRRSGSGVDLGADEFHPRLYGHGFGRVGERPTIRVIGRPGDRVTFTTGAGVLATPVEIPGLGKWHLRFPVTALRTFGPLPSHGFLEFAFEVPPDRAGTAIPMQAAFGTGTAARLSNLFVLTDTRAPRVMEVPGRYPYVQFAIDLARDGDAILVAPGTYRERLDLLGKAIYLKSRDGARVTTLDGQGLGSTILFRSGEQEDTVVDGFTITNGSASGVRCERHWAFNLDPAPTIRNNRIVNNRGTGIVASSPCAPLILDNTITDNTGTSGGGILCGGLSQVVGNEIARNRASFGGGLWLTGRARVARNRIHHNQAMDDGGGLYLSEAYCWIAQNWIHRNEADVGGGVYFDRGFAHFPWNTIYGNKAVSPGSAVYTGPNAAIILRSSIVWKNSLMIDSRYGVFSYCDIEGGWPKGQGHINADPKFVDPGRDDFHLAAASPCVDRGEPGDTAPFDLEGDTRRRGGAADIGADEFGPRLYHLGPARPGATVTLTIVGPPGARVILAAGTGGLTTPLNVPPLGLYHLKGPVGLLDLGPLSAAGVKSIPVSLPANLPAVTVWLQALIGIVLSNPEVVHVERP